MESGKVTRRAALGGMVLAGSAVVDALALEPNWLDVTVCEVLVRGFPSSLDGFSVAQVTDAHLDALLDSTALLRVLGDFLGQLATPQTTVLASLGNWQH